MQAVRLSWPLEIGGLFYRSSNLGPVQTFIGNQDRTDTHFEIHPDDLVEFAYRVLVPGGVICGTFHSHPFGGVVPSPNDTELMNWGVWHAILARVGGDWTTHWYVRS